MGPFTPAAGDTCEQMMCATAVRIHLCEYFMLRPKQPHIHAVHVFACSRRAINAGGELLRWQSFLPFLFMCVSVYRSPDHFYLPSCQGVGCSAIRTDLLMDGRDAFSNQDFAFFFYRRNCPNLLNMLSGYSSPFFAVLSSRMC